MDPSDILLPDEAARILRCGQRQIQILFSRGELRGFRLGRKIRVYRESVEDFKVRNGNNPKPVAAPAVPAAAPAKRARPRAPGALDEWVIDPCFRTKSSRPAGS